LSRMTLRALQPRPAVEVSPGSAGIPVVRDKNLPVPGRRKARSATARGGASARKRGVARLAAVEDPGTGLGGEAPGGEVLDGEVPGGGLGGEAPGGEVLDGEVPGGGLGGEAPGGEVLDGEVPGGGLGGEAPGGGGSYDGSLW